MKIKLLKIVFVSGILCQTLHSQNIASIEYEVPLGVSFVYGFDRHPEFYTQVKTNVSFSFGAYREYPFDDHKVNWFATLCGLTIEQRYYYNISKRQAKGKSTIHRSANFLSVKPSVRYCFYQKNRTDLTGWYLYSCPVNWGLRRAMGKRFYFDGSIGVGPAYYAFDKYWAPMLELNLCFGFVVSRKNT
jgi:hypothetical protein